MATIPRYQQQVSVQALPSVRFRPAVADTSGIAQGLQAVGGAMYEIAQAEQQKQERAQLLEADTALAAVEERVFHDPENGAYARTGRQAMESQDDIWQSWDDEVSQIQGRLPSRLQERFSLLAQDRRNTVTKAFNRHIQTEAGKYADAQLEGRLTAAERLAASNYTDPERIGREVDNALELLSQHHADKPPEWLAEERISLETRIRGGALEQMLARAPDAAEAEYEQHKERMTPEFRAKFEAALVPSKEEARVRQAQGIVDGLMRQGNVRSRLEQAYGIEDPLLRDEVVQRVRDRSAEQERLADADTEKVTNFVEKTLVDLHAAGQLDIERVKEYRDALPPNRYEAWVKAVTTDVKESNPEVVINLMDEAESRDVADDAADAVRNNQLSMNDYFKVRDKNSRADIPSPYKRGQNFIKSALVVSDVNPNPANAQAQANAIVDFDNWFFENPDAKWSDIEREAKSIVQAYQIIPVSELTISMRAPAFLVGGRENPDLDQTELRTIQALERGEITEAEAAKQALLIKQWRETMERSQRGVQ